MLIGVTKMLTDVLHLLLMYVRAGSVYQLFIKDKNIRGKNEDPRKAFSN